MGVGFLARSGYGNGDDFSFLFYTVGNALFAPYNWEHMVIK